jgi:hypothetical protein
LRENHSIVKENHKEPDGFTLGQRVKAIVQAYEANTLETHWVRQLEVDLDFKWDTSKFWWISQYVALRRWARKHRSSRPPRQTFAKIKVSKNHYEIRNLNLFRSRCVTSYNYWEVQKGISSSDRKKPPAKLSLREIHALEKIPFWSWSNIRSSDEIFLESLDSFLKNNSIDDLKSSTMHHGFGLGAKLTKLRGKYRNDELTEVFRKELSARNVSLDPFEEQWTYMYKLVEEYLASSNTKYIRQDTVYKGEAIGSWTSTQRLNFKKGDLTESRRTRLSSLADWDWDASDFSAHNISNSKS